METKQIKLDILPKATLETLNPSPAEVPFSQATVQNPSSSPSPSSSSSAHCPDDSTACGALLLSQRLRKLELQISEMETVGMRRSTEDTSCLLTPPNTPHNMDLVDLVKDSERNSWSCDEDGDDEGKNTFSSSSL